MDAARILLSPQIMEADPACTGSGEYDYHGSDSEDDSSTSTLDSIVVRHVFENGRRYHGFRTGRYLQPNDKQEQGLFLHPPTSPQFLSPEKDRMDMIHHCLKVALTGPYTAPLATLNPLRRILDLGTDRKSVV